MDFEEIPKEWLIKKLTLQESELEHTTAISRGDSELVVPFGYLNDKWVYLKFLMLTNDEIWDFESPQDH